MKKIILFLRIIVSELIYNYKFFKKNHNIIKKLRNSKKHMNVILLGNGSSVNLLSSKKILSLQKKILI